MSWWDDITGKTAAEAAEQAGRERAAGYRAGYGKAVGHLDAGLSAATGYYNKARALFDPYAQAGQQGLDVYLGSLGIGSPEQRSAALNAFQTGPGYQFELDEANRAIERSAAARGNLSSGNTLAALNDRAVGLANQEYGNWQNRLAGLGTMGLQATGQQAANLTGLGGLNYDTGQQKGQYGWNAETGAANATAAGIEGAAAAKTAGAGNIASLGLGIANLALGGLGGMGGFGSMLGGMGGGYSLFGGGGGGSMGNPLSLSSFY
jgi:hypothetical protein